MLLQRETSEMAKQAQTHWLEQPHRFVLVFFKHGSVKLHETLSGRPCESSSVSGNGNGGVQRHLRVCLLTKTKHILYFTSFIRRAKMKQRPEYDFFFLFAKVTNSSVSLKAKAAFTTDRKQKYMADAQPNPSNRR